MSFSWQEIWRLIKRWWWLAILSVIVAAVSSYRASQSVTPLYYSKSTLMIGRVMQDPNPNQADLSTGQQLAATYVQMAKRKPVLQGAIDSLGLQMNWGDLAGRVNAWLVPRTQFLEIGVVDSNPQRAKALADAIAEQLVLLSPANPSGISQDEQAFASQQLENLKVKIEDAEEEIRQLQEELDAAISARQIQDLQNQIQVLESKISGWQSTYSQLLTTLQGGDVNALTIFEDASLPGRPIGTNVRMNVLLAAAIGFALATGAVLLIEFADDTLRIDEHGSESIMRLPLLGTVPRINGPRYDPRSPEAEMFRQLRTKVLLSLPGGDLKSLLITSPQPGDGKTSVASNLAVTMAAGGARVVVVDADLRSPSLHERFDQPNLTGLADLLNADKIQYEPLLPHLLQDTHVPSLSLLPAGRPPLDPSILLASPRMATLLEFLANQFDFVVLDSPPLLVSPDATLLGRLAQGTLLVLTPDKTSRRATLQATEILKSREDIHIIGVALNRISLKRRAYPYYYRQETASQRGYVARLLNKLTKAVFSLPVIGRRADPDLISLSEAAMMLGVHRDTVKRWCQLGRLPAVRKGLRWWVKRDKLQDTLLPPGTTRRLFKESSE